MPVECTRLTGQDSQHAASRAEQQQEREGGYSGDVKNEGKKDGKTDIVNSADSEDHNLNLVDEKSEVVATEKAIVSSSSSDGDVYIPDSQTSIESNDSTSKKETVNR